MDFLRRFFASRAAGPRLIPSRDGPRLIPISDAAPGRPALAPTSFLSTLEDSVPSYYLSEDLARFT